MSQDSQHSPAYPKAGPVSIRTFERHTSALLNEVRNDERTLLLTSNGLLVAVIRPVEPVEAFLPGPTAILVGVKELGTNPSAIIRGLREREQRHFVTYQNKPFAEMLHPDDWDDLDSLFSFADPYDAVEERELHVRALKDRALKDKARQAANRLVNGVDT